MHDSLLPFELDLCYLLSGILPKFWLVILALTNLAVASLNPIIRIAESFETMADEQEYNLGEVVWAKVYGYDWWPALVHPSISTQVVYNDSSHFHDSYRVNFFGDSSLYLYKSNIVPTCLIINCRSILAITMSTANPTGLSMACKNPSIWPTGTSRLNQRPNRWGWPNQVLLASWNHQLHKLEIARCSKLVEFKLKFHPQKSLPPSRIANLEWW